LKGLHINAPALKQLKKFSTNRVLTEARNQANRCSEPSESTGHVGGCTAQAIITRFRRCRSWIPPQGTKSIHQRLTQAEHARSQSGEIDHDSKAADFRLAKENNNANGL
jgi:hypothetical protein